jgi:hypothetical protein
MKTDIEYLRRLEADLEEVVGREAGRLQRNQLSGSIKRNAGRRWVRVAGMAAAFVLIAGAIGLLTTEGGLPSLLLRSGDGADTGSAGDGAAPAAPSPAEDPSTDEGLGYGDRVRINDQGSQQGDLSKIVRDGRIGIVVDDGGFDDAVGDLTFIAEEHGGFILSSSSQNERSGTFVLRIPVNSFDRAIADIRDLAFRIRFQQIRGDDVTAEYIDYQARLEILQDRKARLTALADDADTTAEILALGRQIDEVQLRIEQIQGQLRFLDDQIAESTLRVSIQERTAPAVVPPDEIDNPDLGSAFALGIQGFLRILGAVLVGIGYLVPIVALGALVWFAIVWIRRRRAVA